MFKVPVRLLQWPVAQNRPVMRFHQGAFGAGARHRLAVVAQSFLPNDTRILFPDYENEDDGEDD
jgi:hypothetical protein